MSKRINLTGQVFGRLTVLNYTHTDNKIAFWQCQCVCGVSKTIDGRNLRSGNTNSCGCLQREVISGENCSLYTGGPLKAEYRRYRKNAEKRNHIFDLSEDQVAFLFTQECFYCGADPKKDNRGVIRNGIDRQDNNIGYTWHNTVSCCGNCNAMKMGRSSGEFLAWIEKIVKNLKLV